MSSTAQSAPTTLRAAPGRAFTSFADASRGVLDVATTRLPGSVVYVARLEAEGDALRVVAAQGEPSLGIARGTLLGVDAPERRSTLAVPLELRSGRWVGTLGAVHPDAGRYGASELELLSLLGRLLATELEGEAREEELDVRLFEEALRREWQLAKRGTLRSHLAVLEAHAPRGGDGEAAEPENAVLGRALDAITRATDVVARLDDGRFAVVLVGCATATDARDFRRRLVAELDRAAGDGPAPALLMGTESLDVPPSPQGALEAACYALERERARGAAGPSRLASVLLEARRKLH